MIGKPLVHRNDATRVGRNELLYLLLGQMLTVARVERVADLCEVPLQLREAWLY